MSPVRPSLVLMLVFGVAASASAQTAKVVSIAVTDLKAQGVDPVAAGALTTEVTNTLAGMGVFSVISGEDIKRLLTLEATRQACTGEGDAACLAEIGGALGVDYLIYGEVAKIGQTWSVSLTLLDSNAASAVSRANRKVDAPGKLLAATESLTKVLMRSLLDSNRGFLVLEVREADAQVKIDGRVIGASPLSGRVELAMGPHDVTVTKAGFDSWARTVEVAPDRVSVESIALVPNQRFIAAYEGDARIIRTIAWASAATAVAALGTAGALKLIDDARFDDLVSKRFIERRGVCAEQDPTFGNDFCPTPLGRANGVVDTVDSIERTDAVALGLAVGGVVTAIVSTVLFVTGETPGRYTVFSAGPQATLQPTISPDGAGLGLSVRY